MWMGPTAAASARHTSRTRSSSTTADHLVVIGRAFIEGWKYAGTDTIPSDNKRGGCANYDDWTFGSTLIPGSYDSAKVSLPVNKLAHQGTGKGAAITKHVGLGENTLFLPQQECDATFGPPDNVCTINSQPLSGTFRWGRTK
jgi:hypothetical protein